MLEEDNMEKDKRKGLWAGYKKAGPTLRFTIKAAIFAIILAMVFFFLQVYFGASKRLQRDAQEDRNAKHDKEMNYLTSIDKGIKIQESQHKEMLETIMEIAKNIDKEGVLKESFLSREIKETVKYYPSGYKHEDIFLGPTDISKKLKIVFTFLHSNFSKRISGKQFKEINGVLDSVIQEEQLLPYTWFYKGMLFSYIKDKELEDGFHKVGIKCFKEADKRFTLLLNKYPKNPFLLLYKGMTLTHLSKGKESIIYLQKSLQIDAEIFKKHKLLGVISFWKHIDQNFADEWEVAFNKYWE